MRKFFQKSTPLFMLIIVSMFSAGAAYADKPDWAGGGEGKGKHGEKHGEKYEGNRDDDHHDRDGRRGGYGEKSHAYFNDHQREIAHGYYGERFRRGRCPPGLAKKHNGCMPPGQEKEWRRGYPLPRNVVYYDVPTSVIVELGRPPAGHRYVRVAADILMIAVGTGMVVDAIEDINQR